VRNLLGTIGLGAEHHNAQRVAVLSSHQIGDGGLIVGAVEIGLGERRAEPAKMIDDDVKIFGRNRNNRGPFTHTQPPACRGQSLYRQG